MCVKRNKSFALVHNVIFLNEHPRLVLQYTCMLGGCIFLLCSNGYQRLDKEWSTVKVSDQHTAHMGVWLPRPHTSRTPTHAANENGRQNEWNQLLNWSFIITAG